MDFKHGELTERAIGSFYEVYNRLGYGFLEKVYENGKKKNLVGGKGMEHG